MSHFTRVRTQIKNKNCLIKALEDLGFKGSVQVHEKAVNLTGYQGDTREDVAEIVLPRHAVGGLSNDIGFKLQADGTYEAIVSEYDLGNRNAAKNEVTSKCTGYNEEWQKTLNQYYAKHVIEEEVTAKGYYIDDVTTDEEGNLLFTFETPY